jgi:hypothetical protein
VAQNVLYRWWSTKMRTSYLTAILALGLGLAGCTKQDDRRADSAAHQAGREAYQAGQAIKKGAKEAAHEIREAGKDFRQGYGEAKHEDPKHKK